MIKESHELIINPTIACAKRLQLKDELDTLKELGNKIIHIDVMDGNYVPNLCFDLDTIKEIKENYSFIMDVHLMVTNPQDYIEKLGKLGIDYVSIHLDVTHTPIRLLKLIKEHNMKAGIVLNPCQRVEELKHVLEYVDYVVVMGVEPGFSGQSFLEATYGKIEKLQKIKNECELDFLIEVDGGINIENGNKCIKKGANILIAGAFAVFQGGLKKGYNHFKESLILK